MSELGRRLDALRRASGVSAVNGHDGGALERNAALRLELQRAGVGRRRRSPQRPPISDETLAAKLGGRLIGDGVIRICERFPADATHGKWPLMEPPLQQALQLCAGAAGDVGGSWVFMDTETTGLAGGTGTLVFLLGMARFSGGVLEVNQLLLTGFQGEGAMLNEARDVLGDSDTLVTFNGRSFDSPLLAARYRLSALTDPFAGLAHVDLLHPTRRTFKHCWPDCRLQTAEQRLLDVRRTGDLPGSEAPRAWFDWLRFGRDAALPAVCAHNRLDLLSLTVLPVALHQCHLDPVASGANVLACARHARREGGHQDDEQTLFDYLHRHRARLDAHGLLELARLARRRGTWKLAVALWQQLADAGEAAAVEHLAKYYEHQKRDYARAAALTSRLLACAPNDCRHRRRHARLRARLAGNPCPGA